MKKDRIQIDGVWYVKESTQPEPLNPGDVTLSVERTWETRNWCFSATVIMKDDSDSMDDFYPDPSLKIIDKRLGDRNSSVTHEADNPRWATGVLDNNPESMSEAHEMFDSQGLEEFRAFVRYLIEIKWIVRKTEI